VGGKNPATQLERRPGKRRSIKLKNGGKSRKKRRMGRSRESMGPQPEKRRTDKTAWGKGRVGVKWWGNTGEWNHPPTVNSYAPPKNWESMFGGETSPAGAEPTGGGEERGWEREGSRRRGFREKKRCNYGWAKQSSKKKRNHREGVEKKLIGGKGGT